MKPRKRPTRTAARGALAVLLALSLALCAVPSLWALGNGVQGVQSVQDAALSIKQGSLGMLASSLAGSVEEQVEQQVQVEEEAAILSTGEQAVETGKSYIGVPYVSGGASPSGFDCSGLTMYVYAQLGISLPHNSQRQYNSISTKVSYDELQAGDLVFFGSSTSSIHHVGIYVGNGKYLHAPQSGSSVTVSSLAARSDYAGAARPAAD